MEREGPLLTTQLSPTPAAHCRWARLVVTRSLPPSMIPPLPVPVGSPKRRSEAVRRMVAVPLLAPFRSDVVPAPLGRRSGTARAPLVRAAPLASPSRQPLASPATS